jgi:hypothetical protein
MNRHSGVLHDSGAHAKARIEHSGAGAPWVNFCLTSEAHLQAFQQGFSSSKENIHFPRLSLRYFTKVRLRANEIEPQIDVLGLQKRSTLALRRLPNEAPPSLNTSFRMFQK